MISYLYNFIYKCSIPYIIYLFDTFCIYKVWFQNHQYVDRIKKNIYPKNNSIIKATIHNKDNQFDITYEFMDIVNESRKINNGKIDWDKIIGLYDEIDEMKNCDNFHLDLQYTIDGKEYNVTYSFQDNFIEYPLYSEDEFKEINIDDMDNEVIYAELCKYDDNGNQLHTEDITNTLKKYAGPYGDFYKGKQKVHAKFIKDENGKHILLENKIIKVTDTFCNEKKFDKHDILELEDL